MLPLLLRRANAVRNRLEIYRVFSLLPGFYMRNYSFRREGSHMAYIGLEEMISFGLVSTPIRCICGGRAIKRTFPC